MALAKPRPGRFPPGRLSPPETEDVRDDLPFLIGRQNQVRHRAVGGLKEYVESHLRHAWGGGDRDEARRLGIGRASPLPTDGMAFGAHLPR